MQLFLSRKAASPVAVLQAIFFFIFLSILLVTGIMLISLLKLPTYTMHEFHAEVIAHRLLYSDNTFNYVDALGRVYPGIVDLSRFNSSSLDDEVQYTYDRFVAARFTLLDAESWKIMTWRDERGVSRIRSTYLNEYVFDKWFPLFSAGVKGKTVDGVQYYLPVQYWKRGDLEPAILEVTVLVPTT